MIPDVVAAIFTTMVHNPARAAQAAAILSHDAALPAYWSQYAQGCALLNWERISEARPYLSQALIGFRAANLPVLWHLHCQRALQVQASLATTSTDPVPWEVIIQQYLGHGYALEAARTGVYLARAWHNKRDSAAVERLIEQWMPYFSAPEYASDAARLLRVQGAALVAKGDYHSASQSFEHAIALFRREDDDLETARCQLEQAWLSIVCDHLAEASRLLALAELVFNANDLPLQRAFVGLNKSMLTCLQGNFASALFYCSQAHELFTSIQRTIDIGSCELQLGAIHQQIGHWDAAQAHYTIALAIFESKAASGRVLMCYLNLSQIALLKGDNQRANHFMTLFEQDPTASQYQMLNSILYRHRAHALVNEHQLSAASDLLALAAAKFSATGDTGRAAECWLEHVWLNLQHNPSSALHEGRLQRVAAELHEQPIHRWRALHGLAIHYEAHADYAQALDYYRQASALIFQMRRQLASEHLSSWLFNQAAAMYSSALACAARLNQPLDLVLLTEHQRALTLQRLLFAPPEHFAQTPALERLLVTVRELNLQLDAEPHNPELKAQLNAMLSHYAALISQGRHNQPSPILPEYQLDIAQIQARLQAIHQHNWTVIAYLWTGDGVLLVVITAEDVVWEPLAWDSAASEKLQLICDPISRRYIYRDGDFHTGIADQPWETLVQLGSLLVPASIQARLRADHRLYIIPSGALHAVPWATLRVDAGWLCERAILQTLPSLSLLDFTPPTLRAERVFLGGCSDFAGRYPPLDHVAAELETLEALYPDHYTVDIDRQCSVARLRALTNTDHSQPYDIIHLATHGHVRSSQGITGYLALADGELWLDMIIGLRVKGSQVILSACDGAVTEVLPGEENLSLPWAWIVAGATGVVASLWPTLDGETALLFQEFHRALLVEHDGALALARAQRYYIECNRSPLDWGSFVYTSRHSGVRQQSGKD